MLGGRSALQAEGELPGIADIRVLAAKNDDRRDRVTGNLLSYLLENFLIDGEQYERWRCLSVHQLQTELARDGIMTRAEFETFERQLAAYAGVHTADGE